MNAKSATLDDLYRVEGRAELVNGEIIRMPLFGGFHAHAVGAILFSLFAHSKRTGIGHPLGATVTYVANLPHRTTISPCVSFHLGPPTDDFPEGGPVFAVEIREWDETGPDAERRQQSRRADYFAAGTLVVWDVDLKRGEVRVYRATGPDAPTTYSRGEVADAEPALPGWSMPVDELLPQSANSKVRTQKD